MKQRFELPEEPWPVHRLDRVRKFSLLPAQVHMWLPPTNNFTNPLHINYNYPISQDTTGALLLARSRLQAREFQVQFKEREIEKTYLALVQAGKDAFPKASGTLRSVLVYDLDGRFDRVVPVKADADKGKDTSRSGGVGDVRIVGKTVEAVTHWKLLGSSVRPLPSMPAGEFGLR